MTSSPPPIANTAKQATPSEPIIVHTPQKLFVSGYSSDSERTNRCRNESKAPYRPLALDPFLYLLRAEYRQIVKHPHLPTRCSASLLRIHFE